LIPASKMAETLTKAELWDARFAKGGSYGVRLVQVAQNVLMRASGRHMAARGFQAGIAGHNGAFA